MLSLTHGIRKRIKIEKFYMYHTGDKVLLKNTWKIKCNKVTYASYIEMKVRSYGMGFSQQHFK